jgi:glycosyltransferase involved in cell wall biosynthesis
VNTVSGQRVHADYGYAAEKLQVVPNGFDLERYRPEQTARGELRQSLGLSADVLLVGLVARFSDLKGQKLFIEAMKQVATELPSTHFVLCGTQITHENHTLAGWIRDSGCPERFHLLGERLDIERVHAALDLEVSSSVSEAFSNSIGEALCCGVPCVVTDVGDSAWLIDDAGITVPPQDANAMATACLRLLQASPEERQSLSHRARQRMEQHFDIHVIARQYRDIWQEILTQRASTRSPHVSQLPMTPTTTRPDSHAA